MSSEYELASVEVSLSPSQRFEEFLQSRGKRTTRQRRIILDQVFSRHEHFDADDLLVQLMDDIRARRVSRPTVYRTLSELVEAGLLRKMVLDGRSIYEHDYGYPQHDHLHCQQCGKLIEFQCEQLKEIREAVAKEHRFRVLGHRLIVSGLCADCSQPKRRRLPMELVI